MNRSLESLIAEAERLEKTGRSDAALDMATALVKEHPNEIRAWSLRGYLHAMQCDFDAAASDVTEALSIDNTKIHLFHMRGRYRCLAGDSSGALKDFSRGLELCAQHSDNYYREDLHFRRAETLVQLRREKDAIADLAEVSDGYQVWTTELRTKEDLVERCCLPRVEGRGFLVEE